MGKFAANTDVPVEQSKAGMSLTPRQMQVYRQIQAWWDLRGHGPTLTELASANGVGKTSMFDVTAELRRKGLLAAHRQTGWGNPKEYFLLKRLPARSTLLVCVGTVEPDGTVKLRVS